jgi:hypothetical protein
VRILSNNPRTRNRLIASLVAIDNRRSHRTNRSDADNHTRGARH